MAGLSGEDPFKGQNTLRKVLMVVIFVVVLVVIGLVTLVVVTNNKDAVIDQNVDETTNTNTFETSSNDLPPAPTVSGDNERLTALESVMAAMKLYFRDHGRDPEVRGITAQDRWVNLMGHLVSGGYLISPVQDAGGANYDYQVTSDGKSFVIAATLTRGTPQQLENDLDGQPLGVNCEDPVYCLGYVK